jgi:hypothetical protein
MNSARESNTKNHITENLRKHLFIQNQNNKNHQPFNILAFERNYQTQRGQTKFERNSSRTHTYSGSLGELKRIKRKKANPMKVIYKNLQKYSINRTQVNIKLINDIIYDEKKHIVCIFKDYLLWDEHSGFLKRFYNYVESTGRIPKICSYYVKYSLMKPNYFMLNCFKMLYKNFKKQKKLLELMEENEDRIPDNNMEKDKTYSKLLKNSQLVDSHFIMHSESIIQRKNPIYESLSFYKINPENYLEHSSFDNFLEQHSEIGNPFNSSSHSVAQSLYSQIDKLGGEQRIDNIHKNINQELQKETSLRNAEKISKTQKLKEKIDVLKAEREKLKKYEKEKKENLKSQSKKTETKTSNSSREKKIKTPKNEISSKFNLIGNMIKIFNPEPISSNNLSNSKRREYQNNYLKTEPSKTSSLLRGSVIKNSHQKLISNPLISNIQNKGTHNQNSNTNTTRLIRSRLISNSKIPQNSPSSVYNINFNLNLNLNLNNLENTQEFLKSSLNTQNTLNNFNPSQPNKSKEHAMTERPASIQLNLQNATNHMGSSKIQNKISVSNLKTDNEKYQKLSRNIDVKNFIINYDTNSQGLKKGKNLILNPSNLNSNGNNNSNSVSKKTTLYNNMIKSNASPRLSINSPKRNQIQNNILLSKDSGSVEGNILKTEENLLCKSLKKDGKGVTNTKSNFNVYYKKFVSSNEAGFKNIVSKITNNKYNINSTKSNNSQSNSSQSNLFNPKNLYRNNLVNSLDKKPLSINLKNNEFLKELNRQPLTSRGYEGKDKNSIKIFNNL